MYKGVGKACLSYAQQSSAGLLCLMYLAARVWWGTQVRGRGTLYCCMCCCVVCACVSMSSSFLLLLHSVSADYPKVKLSLTTKTDSGVVSATHTPLDTVCGWPHLFLYFLCLWMCTYLCLSSQHVQEFETSGSHNLDKGRTTGSLSTTLDFPDQGWH